MPEIDREYLEAFQEALATVGATDAELELAAKLILAKEQWFPAPATVIEFIMQIRQKEREAREKAFWSSLVEAIDENGVTYLAPLSRVHNGQLLPPGKGRGNGLPANQVPMLPKSLSSMSDGSLKMLANVIEATDFADEVKSEIEARSRKLKNN